MLWWTTLFWNLARERSALFCYLREACQNPLVGIYDICSAPPCILWLLFWVGEGISRKSTIRFYYFRNAIQKPLLPYTGLLYEPIKWTLFLSFFFIRSINDYHDQRSKSIRAREWALSFLWYRTWLIFCHHNELFWDIPSLAVYEQAKSAPLYVPKYYETTMII